MNLNYNYEETLKIFKEIEPEKSEKYLEKKIKLLIYDYFFFSKSILILENYNINDFIDNLVELKKSRYSYFLNKIKENLSLEGLYNLILHKKQINNQLTITKQKNDNLVINFLPSAYLIILNNFKKPHFKLNTFTFNYIEVFKMKISKSPMLKIKEKSLIKKNYFEKAFMRLTKREKKQYKRNKDYYIYTKGVKEVIPNSKNKEFRLSLFSSIGIYLKYQKLERLWYRRHFKTVKDFIYMVYSELFNSAVYNKLVSNSFFKMNNKLYIIFIRYRILHYQKLDFFSFFKDVLDLNFYFYFLKRRSYNSRFGLKKHRRIKKYIKRLLLFYY